MRHNLTPSTLTVRVLNATAAGTSVLNSTGVDTLGYSAVRFVAMFGALTSTQVTTMSVTYSDDNSTWTSSDVASSKTTALADADGNKMLIVDIYKPTHRYLRANINRATANAAVDGVIAELYLADDSPITKDTSVSAQVVLNTPAIGTA